MPKVLSAEYHAYIRSVHWHGVRVEALRRYGRRCAGCMSSDSIHMHHLFYPHRLTDSKPEHLLPLCESCHKATHGQTQFHPTTFDESQCGMKRRETIRFLQQRAYCQQWSRPKKPTIHPNDLRGLAHQKAKAMGLTIAQMDARPKYVSLPCRYLPRRTKTRNFLTPAEYAEKLPDPWQP